MTHADQFDEVGFDIPVRSGGVCYIQFTLPKKGTNIGGYNWIVTGSGKIEVYGLDSESDIMDGDFSWDNRPERVPHTPILLITVSPGITPLMNYLLIPYISTKQPKDGGEASVSGQGFSCEPGSRVYLELVIPYRAPGSFHWYGKLYGSTAFTAKAITNGIFSHHRVENPKVWHHHEGVRLGDRWSAI